jgi:hypothetical protein
MRFLWWVSGLLALSACSDTEVGRWTTDPKKLGDTWVAVEHTTMGCSVAVSVDGTDFHEIGASRGKAKTVYHGLKPGKHVLRARVMKSAEQTIADDAWWASYSCPIGQPGSSDCKTTQDGFACEFTLTNRGRRYAVYQYPKRGDVRSMDVVMACTPAAEC